MRGLFTKHVRLPRFVSWVLHFCRFLIITFFIACIMFMILPIVYPTDVIPGEKPSRMRWFGIEMQTDHLIAAGIWFCSALASFTHLVVSNRTGDAPAKSGEQPEGTVASPDR